MEPFLKPLSAQEEKSCLDAYQRGDTKARDILVERNLRLVAHVVKKYQGLPDDLDDLISIGTIGLIKAVMTYDSKKGNRLAAYAARCIDNELLMYLRSKKKTAREISLYEPIGTDKEGNEIHLLDIVEGGGEDIAEQYNRKEDAVRLYCYLDSELKEQEKQVLLLRYGLGGKAEYTQKQVAARLGISRSYVSRIEKNAIVFSLTTVSVAHHLFSVKCRKIRKSGHFPFHIPHSRRSSWTLCAIRAQWFSLLPILSGISE